MGLYRGYIGIMEKKMETTVVFRGYIAVIKPKPSKYVFGDFAASRVWV